MDRRCHAGVWPMVWAFLSFLPSTVTNAPLVAAPPSQPDAAEASASHHEPSASVPGVVNWKDLVRRLGHPSFPVREAASAEIRALGRAAVPALQEGVKDTDLEVAVRCRRLLPLALRTDEELRVAAFLAGDEGAAAGLPALSLCRRLVGTDYRARELYTEMYRGDPKLLEALEKDPARVGQQLAERFRSTQRMFFRAPAERRDDLRFGQVAAVLLAAADARVPLELSDLFAVYNFVYTPAFSSRGRIDPATRKLFVAFQRQRTSLTRFDQGLQAARALNCQESIETVFKPLLRDSIVSLRNARAPELSRINLVIGLARQLQMIEAVEDELKPLLRSAIAALRQSSDPNLLIQAFYQAQSLNMHDSIDGVLRPAIRRLAADHIARPNAAQSYSVLNLAVSAEVPEALELSLVVMSSKRQQGWVRGQAVVVVARLGSKTTVAQLESLLDDRTEVGRSAFNQMQIVAQVRDVALAAILSLHGESLADYGYPWFQLLRGQRLADTGAGVCGFADDKTRTAALEKWKKRAAVLKR